MTLRQKTLILTSGLLLLTLLIVYGVSRAILFRNVALAEKADTAAQTLRASAALQRNLSGLGRLTLDWASRDDTYRFVEDGNATFIQKNLSTDSLSRLRVNTVAFVRKDGSLTYARGFDLGAQKEVPFPESLRREIARQDDRSLIRHAGPQDRHTGILRQPEGILQASACPILDSEEREPMRGTLIFGRYLDRAELEDLLATPRADVRILPADDPSIPPDAQRQLLSAPDRPIVIRPVDRKIISGVALLEDVYGHPTLALKVSLPREIYAHAHGAFRYFLRVLLAAGAILILGTILLLGRLVLNPLSRLIADVTHIGKQGDFSGRVTSRGDSELRDLSGAINGMLDTLERSQKQLQRSQQILHAVVQHQTELICRFRPDGVLTFANDVYCRHIGKPLEELLDRDFYRLLPEDDRAFVQRNIATLTPEKPWATHEHRVLLPTGEVRWHQWTNRAIFDEHGTVTEVQAVGRDITEQRKTEDALRESEQRYRSVIETAHDIIFTASTDGAIASLNPAFEKATGWKREEWIGRPLSAIVHPGDRLEVQRSIQKLVRGEPASLVELRVAARSGGHVMAECVLTPLFHETRVTGSLGIARDVTDRKKMEQQLVQAQKLEVIGQLAGGIAHDFSNLLTSIMGFSRLTLDELPQGHPLRSYVDEIVNAGDRGAKLVRQLLALGRKPTAKVGAIDLNEVVRHMDALLRRTLGEDIELVTRLGEDAGSIEADAGQIEQVIMNLALNARDAMPRGGRLSIVTEAAVVPEDSPLARKLPPGRCVRLAVRDTGCGMAPEARQHIFEPFFTTKEYGLGSGLGLATLYGTISQCRGHVEFDSEVNQGTEFRILFPRVEAEGDKPRVGSFLSVPGGTERILAVEDDETVRELTVRILESLGYGVVHARDGDEALRLCADGGAPVDLIVTDVVMPHMGGPEMIKQMEAKGVKTKVLYTSGFTDGRIGYHGILSSDIHFIAKPYTREELARKVREVLDEVQA